MSYTVGADRPLVKLLDFSVWLYCFLNYQYILKVILGCNYQIFSFSVLVYVLFRPQPKDTKIKKHYLKMLKSEMFDFYLKGKKC